MKRSFIMVVMLAITAFHYSLAQQGNRAKHIKEPHARNIIFLIGDGMGLNHILAGMTVNGDTLALEGCTHVGLQKTKSSNRYITESAASGTAMSCGRKTYNGAIGVDPDTVSLISILKVAEQAGKSTGLISTSSITHATPATFISNQPNRGMYEEIAADFLRTDVDVVIGGGADHFTRRKDGRNLAQELRQKGYQVLFDFDSLQYISGRKIYCLGAPEHAAPAAKGRGNMLSMATRTALDLLSANDRGFFIMIEGSQIDWGGHDNDKDYVVTEMLDFDLAIKEALDFARNHEETLVVVTADHETGGMMVLNGDPEEGTIETTFTTSGHTPTLIPVFAYGPGSELFTGIYENTGFKERFLKAYGMAE